MAVMPSTCRRGRLGGAGLRRLPAAANERRWMPVPMPMPMPIHHTQPPRPTQAHPTTLHFGPRRSTPIPYHTTPCCRRGKAERPAKRAAQPLVARELRKLRV